jgi:hypothetical protein
MPDATCWSTMLESFVGNRVDVDYVSPEGLHWTRAWLAAADPAAGGPTLSYESGYSIEVCAWKDIRAVTEVRTGDEARP